MTLLDRVRSPEDLKALSPDDASAYCDALRAFLIESVSRTGGHLGSNLGVVELTVALHRVFDFAHDRLVLDTSHQVYPHKVITGRRERFPTLRATDGLSGFMHRGESVYDTFTSGHAGTAVSVAAGMALADQLRGVKERRIVAVVGDASAGSGVTFEALNHLGHLGHASAPDAGREPPDVLVILNDNQWSIARTVGALGKYLNRIRTLPVYREGKRDLLEALSSLPLVGERVSRWAASVKESVANYVSPGHLFRELGWTYFGPENGHDEARLEQLLRELKRVKGPVLLHVITEKGRGAPLPGTDAAHAVSAAKVAPKACAQAPAAPAPTGPASLSWSAAFGRAVERRMQQDPRVLAITAAMPDGTGLVPVMKAFPERVLDVGICEQHAVALAGGLADLGMRPIAAIYSTFLQRGYDQVWQEVVVQGLPVVLAMDRAGIVGGDGVTHQGVFDIAYLRCFPGMTLMAPADLPELEAMLTHALALAGPSALRFPRGNAPDASLPGNTERLRTGKGVLLRPGADLVFLAYGNMVPRALEAAQALEGEGISAGVWNARFAKPLDGAAVEGLARRVPLLLTLEEHAMAGGFGAAVLEHLAGLETPAPVVVRVLGVPDSLVPHGEASDWLARLGLDVKGLVERARREVDASRAQAAKRNLGLPRG